MIRDYYCNGHVANGRFNLTSCCLEKNLLKLLNVHNILRNGSFRLNGIYGTEYIATDHINFLRNGERCVEKGLSLHSAHLQIMFELHKLLQNNLASYHYVTMLYSQKKKKYQHAISK